MLFNCYLSVVYLCLLWRAMLLKYAHTVGLRSSQKDAWSNFENVLASAILIKHIIIQIQEQKMFRKLLLWIFCCSQGFDKHRNYVCFFCNSHVIHPLNKTNISSETSGKSKYNNNFDQLEILDSRLLLLCKDLKRCQNIFHCIQITNYLGSVLKFKL